MRQVTELMQSWLDAKEAERVAHGAEKLLNCLGQPTSSRLSLFYSIISASTAIVLAVIR
jgi:hypothetical protein